MNELITVRSFSNSMDFEMVKSYLESCGLKCFGQDEIFNQLYWPNVNGGIKLQVPTDQAEEAIQLLLEGGYLKKKDFEPTPEMKWMEKVLDFFHKK
jgi:hypothetical protein